MNTTTSPVQQPNLAKTTENRISLPAISEGSFVEVECCADLLDQASEMTQRYNEGALEAFQRERIIQTIHAYERIQQGLAEICEDCGKKIEAERMFWLPDATRCVPCQEKYEKSRQIRR